jgi:hypothetical protein
MDEICKKLCNSRYKIPVLGCSIDHIDCGMHDYLQSKEYSRTHDTPPESPIEVPIETPEQGIRRKLIEEIADELDSEPCAMYGTDERDRIRGFLREFRLRKGN